MRDKRRVLVVDDDDEMRRVIADALRKDGHDVIDAKSGDDALRAIAATENADVDRIVLVLDVRMPGISGLQVLARLRLQRARVQVVVMTAFPDHATYMIAQSLGAIALLEKPFEMKDLSALVAASVRDE